MKLRHSRDLLRNRAITKRIIFSFDNLLSLDLSYNSEQGLSEFFSIIHEYYLEKYLSKLAQGGIDDITRSSISNLKILKLKYSEFSSEHSQAFQNFLKFLMHHKLLEYLDISFSRLNLERVKELVRKLGIFSRLYIFCNKTYI